MFIYLNCVYFLYLFKCLYKVYCTNCKRETKKHYDYCKICGKRQLFLLNSLQDDAPAAATDINSKSNSSDDAREEDEDKANSETQESVS